jgi:hypothetical protein
MSQHTTSEGTSVPTVASHGKIDASTPSSEPELDIISGLQTAQGSSSSDLLTPSKVKYNPSGGIADAVQVSEITSLIQHGHVKEREEALLMSAGSPSGPRAPSLNLTDPHTMPMNTRSDDDHSAVNLHFPEETLGRSSQTTIDNLPVEVVTRILTIGCEEREDLHSL